MSTHAHKTRTDIYEDVTARIIDELERGPEQWAQSWALSVDVWNPRNHLTDAGYRGINLLLLAIACAKRGALVNRWTTFNQARDKGGMVRKGAKGVPLVLFKPLDAREAQSGEERADDVDDARSRRVLVRHFHVFHVSDCDGLPEAQHIEPQDGSLAARIVRGSGATVVPGKPCYRVSEDVVQLPDVGCFDSVEAYWATAFHELIHWTAPRVGREVAMKRFGDEAYASEELVAELGAAMLCGVTGVPVITQCAAYLDSWLKALRADKRAIFTVASQAQKAADYLLNMAGDGMGRIDDVSRPLPTGNRGCLSAVSGANRRLDLCHNRVGGAVPSRSSHTQHLPAALRKNASAMDVRFEDPQRVRSVVSQHGKSKLP